MDINKLFDSAELAVLINEVVQEKQKFDQRNEKIVKQIETFKEAAKVLKTLQQNSNAPPGIRDALVNKFKNIRDQLALSKFFCDQVIKLETLSQEEIEYEL